jgi:hypothetical protein
MRNALAARAAGESVFKAADFAVGQRRRRQGPRINEAFERPQMPDRDFLEQFQLDRIGRNWLATLSQLVGS